jgi:16S rRNA (adenine1518-N6/adenine1519-N6)-dimethyltransferase
MTRQPSRIRSGRPQNRPELRTGGDRKRHALGQHFLRDSLLAEKIARAGAELAQTHQCRGILEVGPGDGALTEPLIQALRDIIPPGQEPRVLLSEADRKIAAHWAGRREAGFGKEFNLRVCEGDFLNLPEAVFLERVPLGVVSNLPYSAGTPIAVRLLDHPESVPFLLLMFQAEVARRFRAEPNSEDWGSLSIWTQNRWEVSKFAFVPPGAFSPPPKVDSEVVLFRPREKARIPLKTPAERRLFDQLLRVAFAHRRKMLRSGLPSQGPWKASLEKAGIDGTLRSEALGWADWEKWWTALQEIRENEADEST